MAELGDVHLLLRRPFPVYNSSMRITLLCNNLSMLPCNFKYIPVEVCVKKEGASKASL